jgi:putative SOS response-associated peptidase YedK
MCGRYALYEAKKLAARFQAARPDFQIEDSYNVAPGHLMPVVIGSGGGRGRRLKLMKWGLIPRWAKEAKIGYKLINARSEGAFDKPSWRGPLKHQRCLVPARGFYEWRRLDGKKAKQPYFIRPRDQELFAFAGIYDAWVDPEGREVWTFAIMTTEPNAEMASIHNRMPVILHPDDESLWLDPSLGTDREDREVLATLLRSYEDGKLEMHEVSSDVNVVRNNENKLIYPINSQ